MELHEVLKRATEDEEFAKHLKAKADRAKVDGPDSEATTEYLTVFADTPEDLERLRQPQFVVAILEMSGLTTYRHRC